MESGVDVLVSRTMESLGAMIAHMLSHDPRVGRADHATGRDAVVAMLSARQYDLHLIGESSLPICREITQAIAGSALSVNVPTRRILIGEAPSAMSVAQAIWMGFDGVIDLSRHAGSASVGFLLDEPATPVEYLRLSATGAPIVAICHDKTDIRILTGIVEGLTDPEIAEKLHYAVQSIRNRVSRILAESGARNRTHLVALFLQDGGVSC